MRTSLLVTLKDNPPKRSELHEFVERCRAGARTQWKPIWNADRHPKDRAWCFGDDVLRKRDWLNLDNV